MRKHNIRKLPRFQQDLGKISLFNASILLSSISLGLLLVTAPLCWFTVGWIVGFVSMLFATALQTQSSSALLRLVFSQGCYSYEDIALLNFGKKCQILVNLSLILAQGSVCVGALYVASTSIKGFFNKYFRKFPVGYQIRPVFISLVSFFFLSQFRNKLKELKQEV